MSLSADIESNGFSIQPSVLEPEVVRRFHDLVDRARARSNLQNVSNSSGTYGLRNLTDVLPETKELLLHPGLTGLVESVLGGGAFMVRATLFDKTPGANWGVFWHQDLSIAVAQKHHVDGFAAWTRKADVPCVQPPTELMEQILAVRLHLDDCTAANGALKVLPGTHRLARLSTTDVEAQQQQRPQVVCEVPAGGAVLMRPLLLHASSPMEEPTSRRVIHFEFAGFQLPPPLQWKFQLPCQRPR
ncbi:MAG: phytanoyl-CoA dioxygenase family protein [Fuerstiella sp.]